MSKNATTYNNMFIKNDYIQALKGYSYHYGLTIEKDYIYKKKVQENWLVYVKKII